MLKILFMGTPDFAKESLEALYNEKYDIIGVVTNPDKPKGRGMKLDISPVKEFAIDKNLRIFQPLKVRNNIEFINEIKYLNPDVICVVAYGKILPKELLDIPKYGSINVHGSLLPKYRGAAPIQWAVINGENITGITTMYMDEGMDTGDMILREEVTIGEDETTGELWQRLSKIGAQTLVKTIKLIEEGNAPREKQPSEFTLAPMLNKEMAKIDWNKNANEIKNLVRGLNPIMGAYTFLNDKKIKLWKVTNITEEDFYVFMPNVELKNKQNGQVLISNDKRGLYIKTKNGIISVEEIQGENSKKMNIKDYLRGNKIEEGEILN